MIRVAMLSFWHVHARDYARQATQHPEVEIVAAWDEDPERGRAQAKELGVDFHEDLADVLAREDVDGVIVDTPTIHHRDVMVQAAQAGKHIFTEKVLALTTAEANEIVRAVNQAGVKLTVSLPRVYDNYTLAINDVLASGQLGDLTLVRTRLSHNGAVGEGWLPQHFYAKEQTGGGALVDLGCHPMYLARIFLGGLPDTVSATYGHVTGREVDDNAVAILQYPNGAIGVVEAGFVNRYSPFSIEVHGTEGSLLFGTPDAKLLVRSPRQKDGESFVELELPDRAPMAFEQWVAHINDGTTATENVALAVDLTRLMEAANLSVQNGAPVRLDSLAQ
jgi:1,5-anhydro-D-fructose reductase (1,5-anhydro-D-mannitol-forming)